MGIKEMIFVKDDNRYELCRFKLKSKKIYF